MNLSNLVVILVCICFGIAIGMAAMQQEWLNWVYAHLPYVVTSVITGVAILAAAGLLAYLLLKRWIRRKLGITGEMTGEQVVVGLADKLTNRNELEAPDAQDRIHSLMVNLGLYYVRSVAIQRYFLLIGGVFTALVGMATVFLLYEQNKKLDIQTRQIEIQSQANTVASLLMEGTRRAALSAEQTQLFADIRAEATAIRMDDTSKAERACPQPKENETTNDLRSCWREVELPDKSKIELVHLSDDLFQRVRAYALRSTPYPIAVRKQPQEMGETNEGQDTSDRVDVTKSLEEQFEFPELSPERGQLLQTLVLNEIEVANITFAFADLNGLDLSGAYLRGADLSGANLSSADLTGAVLFGARLLGVDLRVAYLADVNLREAYLRKANLSGAVISGADLAFAVLWDAQFSETQLWETDLTEAFVEGADFTDVAGPPMESDQLQTNGGRKKALDDWLGSLFAPSLALDKAKLPKGYKVTCTMAIVVDEDRGNSCPAEGGWTITYEDQPEYEPTADANSKGVTSD